MYAEIYRYQQTIHVWLSNWQIPDSASFQLEKVEVFNIEQRLQVLLVI